LSDFDAYLVAESDESAEGMVVAALLVVTDFLHLSVVYRQLMVLFWSAMDQNPSVDSIDWEAAISFDVAALESSACFRFVQLAVQRHYAYLASE
jgi:hypothetical protein